MGTKFVFALARFVQTLLLSYVVSRVFLLSPKITCRSQWNITTQEKNDNDNDNNNHHEALILFIPRTSLLLPHPVVQSILKSVDSSNFSFPFPFISITK
jgi:hypothetical protein